MKIFKMLLPGMAILMMVNCAFAQTWTQTSAPSNDWASVASSADGNTLAAVSLSITRATSPDGRTITTYGDGLIYISTNSGADWIQSGALSNNWSAVASSAEGTKLVAAASGDLIYTSTNLGSDWAATSAPSNSWSAVASSADGATLDAAANGDGIYFSTNSGLDWTESDAPITNWNSIACSADGTKAIAANGSQVWISEDSGATWTQTDLPSLNWSSVCSSADGNKLATVGISTSFTSPTGRTNSSPGGIGISANSGASWTTNGNFNAGSIASSADGSKLIAGNGSGIYVSTDSGTTWIQETNIPASISALSADGNKSAFVAEVTVTNSLAGGRTITTTFPDAIYTSFSTPSPQMNITPTNGSFKLSWLIPSTNFVMQQSSDLASWSDVTNAPVLNLTNLQNEVILSPSNSSGYYRLKTP